MTSTARKRVPCIVMSRVVGYISIVSQWNKGKKQEWKDRVTYGEPTPERLAALASVSVPDLPDAPGPHQ